ncbi:MAG: aldo/keto reductase [Spirochaetes bacterium]|nr:aldo/keto reductase [Spirochaetota bacterium]
MLYRKVQKNGDEISILGFGCMRFTEKNGKIIEDMAIRQLRKAIDGGVNYIDTAFPYHMGKSEPLLSKALQDGYREKVKIATKLPHWQTECLEDMHHMLDLQLERIATDYIDYYLIHNLNRNSWEHIKSIGVIEFMDQIKKSGKVKNIGFSYHGDKDTFPVIVDEYPWDFCEIQYNYLDENNQAGKAGLEYAAGKNLAVVIMEPLRGGSLSRDVPPEIKKIWDEAEVKRTPAEWSLRWIWNHPQVTTVLSGMNNDDHIEENLKIANTAYPESLTDKELSLISRVKSSYQKLMKVPCTGCNYCMPCPVNVNIPGCFETYNNYFMFQKDFDYIRKYFMGTSGLLGGKKAYASLCINCGKCEQKCPQNIAIREELQKVKKIMEKPFIKNILLPIVIFFYRIISRQIIKKRKKLQKNLK